VNKNRYTFYMGPAISDYNMQLILLSVIQLSSGHTLHTTNFDCLQPFYFIYLRMNVPEPSQSPITLDLLTFIRICPSPLWKWHVTFMLLQLTEVEVINLSMQRNIVQVLDFPNGLIHYMIITKKNLIISFLTIFALALMEMINLSMLFTYVINFSKWIH